MMYYTTLWKENFNSVGQQNEQSPLTSNHWTVNRPLHMALEVQVLSWDRHKQLLGKKNVVKYLPYFYSSMYIFIKSILV